MTLPIGLATAAVLFLLSLLHVYWAAGGSRGSVIVLPEKDGAPLFRPGPGATLVVAALLAGAGLILLARLGLWGAGLAPALVRIGSWLVAAAFLGRAVGDFRWVGFFKRVRATPFARWDTWLFSPLCVLVGAGAVLVALGGSEK